MPVITDKEAPAAPSSSLRTRWPSGTSSSRVTIFKRVLLRGWFSEHGGQSVFCTDLMRSTFLP
ncbi:hypothetical protein DMB84_018825 [Pectobacterium aquaticum]|uniref:Uncharacterized protein n=1 Tax=Pectobacterium aquaticum TaxID=2204145 RepID=A0AA93DKK5_9GAMM|nr:hypothetical protein DMB79_015270 [Pectobacterium aquaticum]RRN97855.1 hypothetical protein DMB83_019665 [Pectobacterium aquaticum]RRO03013.1 hypothetical protein DMB85_019695 [Pectobacterium aquaticum]RRO05966.1 hypothetical protein DMB81_014390 [Pectobacterium aquaticum]RRO12577.1 hypothetical protein DMB84_018825 [Pectobacterium aquaticum]